MKIIGQSVRMREPCVQSRTLGTTYTEYACHVYAFQYVRCTVYRAKSHDIHSLTHSHKHAHSISKWRLSSLISSVFFLCALSNMTAGHPSVPISRWGKQGTKIITFAHSHTNIAADIHIGHNILGSHKVRKAINGFGIEPHRKYVPFRTNRVEK